MFWEMTNSIVVMWDRDPNQTLIVKVKILQFHKRNLSSVITYCHDNHLQ